MAIDVAEAAERGIGRRSSRTPATYSQGGKTFARMRGSLVDGLEAYADKLAGISRRVAHAGAIVMYDEMRIKAPVDSGILRDSIYRKFLNDASKPGTSFYAIGPNKKEARHWFNVEYGHYRYNRATPVGFMKSTSQPDTTWGTRTHDLGGALDVPVWVPAVPYIRPTFEAKKQEAITAMRLRAGELVTGRAK